MKAVAHEARPESPPTRRAAPARFVGLLASVVAFTLLATLVPSTAFASGGSPTTNYPTANAVVTTGWTNPNNAHADDTSYATATPGKSLGVSTRWTNFGFDSSIPAGSTINSVVIKANYKVSTTKSVAELRAQATVGSTNYPATAQTHTAEPTTDTDVSFDVSYAKAWTRDNLLNANFKVLLTAYRGNSNTAVTFSLDNVRVVVAYTAPPVLTQTSYRWFQNADQSGNLTPLAAQNTAITQSAVGPVRVRMTVGVTQGQQNAVSNKFSLQYAERVGGTCAGGDESFTYLSNDYGAIRFHTNSTVNDGSAFTADSDDPVYSGQTNVGQQYKSSPNMMSVNTSIPVNQNGIYDFSLSTSNAPPSTTYCLRFIGDNFTPLDGYLAYPEITTPAPSLNQSSYRWFENADQGGVFGTPGYVEGGGTTKDAKAIAKDSTYMYVGGGTVDSSYDRWRIEKRLLSDGSLVTGFGTNGVVTDTVAVGTIHDIVIDSTYMYVVGDGASSYSRDWYIEKRLLSDGSLVAGFGTNGLVIVTAGENLNAIAIDSTYMYLAGYSGAFYDWRIEKRLLSDGSPVNTFGTSGVQTSTSGSIAHTIAIDGTYMYVAGVNDTADWRIEKRQLSDGALVSGFGTSGAITVTSGQYIYDLAIDATYVYVVGDNASGRWSIGKYQLSNGVPAAGFGSGGVVAGGSKMSAHAISIDSTYLYVAGQGNDGLYDYDRRIQKRLLSDGSLVTSFGSSGTVIVPGANGLGDIEIDATHVYVAAQTGSAWQTEKRLLSNGTYATDFGGTGTVLGGASADVTSAAKDSTYLYVASTGSGYNWKIEKRRLSDGSVDTSFGTDGYVTASSTGVYVKDIKIDSTHMWVAGTTAYNGGDWRIEKRLLSDGSLVADFGTNGVVTGNAASESLSRIVIDSTNIFAFGTDSNGDWRVEKRLLSDGSPVTGFGTDGVVTGDTTTALAGGLAIDSTYLYLTGSNSSDLARVEKRLLSDGSLETSFGTSGVLTNAYGTYYWNDIAVDSSHMYLGGVSYNDSEFAYWIVEKRSLSDGSIDSGFRFSGGADGAANIAIDSTYLYVYGYTGRVEKRLLSNGAGDTAFGTNGALKLTNAASRVLVDGTYLYAVGESSAGTLRLDRRLVTSGQVSASYPTAMAPLANQDTAYTLTSSNPVRLRTTLGVSGIYLDANVTFKLRFAPKVGASCAGGDETYADVGTSSGAIRYYDNTNALDGQNMWRDANDPTYNGLWNVPWTYEEANNFTNSSRLDVNQSGIWDFAIDPAAAPSNTTYCFMITKSDGTLLNTYTTYPEFTTPPPA